MTDELIQSLDVDSEFDAMAKLRPGEPYFLLLGRDRLAPGLVDQWGKQNRQRALDEFDAGQISEERRDRELRKSTQAEAKGWELAAFKAGDMAKRVAGEETAKTYSGFELPEEVKRRDALQRQRLDTASALNNAIAELAALEPLVTAVDMTGETLFIRDLVAQLEATVERIRPPNRAEVLGKSKRVA